MVLIRVGALTSKEKRKRACIGSWVLIKKLDQYHGNLSLSYKFIYNLQQSLQTAATKESLCLGHRNGLGDELSMSLRSYVLMNCQWAWEVMLRWECRFQIKNVSYIMGSGAY